MCFVLAYLLFYISTREYDVPYHVRVSIDLKIHVGHWYSVKGHGLAAPDIVLREDLVDRPVHIIYTFYTLFTHTVLCAWIYWEKKAFSLKGVKAKIWHLNCGSVLYDCYKMLLCLFWILSNCVCLLFSRIL